MLCRAGVAVVLMAALSTWPSATGRAAGHWARSTLHQSLTMPHQATSLNLVGAQLVATCLHCLRYYCADVLWQLLMSCCVPQQHAQCITMALAQERVGSLVTIF